MIEINDLFDRIAEAFQRFQQEIAEQKDALANPTPTGLGPEKKAEKTEKIIEKHFPKRECPRNDWLNCLDCTTY